MFCPFVSITANTAAPRLTVPSTDKSAISSILYVINTPIAIIPHIIPWEIAPGIALNNVVISTPKTSGNYLFCSNSFVTFWNCYAKFFTDCFIIFLCKFWSILDIHLRNICSVCKNLVCHLACSISKIIITD